MPKEFIGNSSNSELVLDLIEILRKESSLFETFLELLERRQEALVKNEVTCLNAIAEERREKVIQAGILAKKRERLVAQLSPYEQVAENPTISKLMTAVSSDQAAMLSRLRDTIFEMNDKIVSDRKLNETLINRSRENIMKTIELLARIKVPDNKSRFDGKVNRVQTNHAGNRKR